MLGSGKGFGNTDYSGGRMTLGNATLVIHVVNSTTFRFPSSPDDTHTTTSTQGSINDLFFLCVCVVEEEKKRKKSNITIL